MALKALEIPGVPDDPSVISLSFPISFHMPHLLFFQMQIEIDQLFLQPSPFLVVIASWKWASPWTAL